jgi:hypothetical protein
LNLRLELRSGGFGSRCGDRGHHREKHASKISPTETERRRYVCRAPVRVSIVAVFSVSATSLAPFRTHSKPA